MSQVSLTLADPGLCLQYVNTKRQERYFEVKKCSQKMNQIYVNIKNNFKKSCPPIVFAPLSVIPTPQMFLYCRMKGRRKKNNNYYCLYNVLKAFIATLGGPHRILLLF